MSIYAHYTEPTSGLVLNLPKHWRIDIAPNPYLAIMARASEKTLRGVNLVATVEQPPPTMQDLAAYTDHQLKAITDFRAGQNLCMLGRRDYTTERETLTLATYSFVQNKTVLACFQIFTLNQTIGTVITITVPLAFLDTGLHLSQHTIQTFIPATRLYHHPFYQEINSRTPE